MLRRTALWWAGAAVCVAGCATSTSSTIKPDHGFNPARAYLYGRFFIKGPEHEEGFGGKQSVGIDFQCEHGSSYTFGSTNGRDVQVMEIKPGRCWLMRVTVADEYGLPQKTLPVDRKDQRPLDFAAGHAYYLGDYFAKADSWHVQQGFGTVEHWESWALSPGVGNRYAQTTADMRRRFPNLAAVPTIDQPLVPRQEHKWGNGIGPSPDEPPLSPARVAAIAPFIKRSYGTPAQCEAACSAGQCFPYRAESAAAMACVVHCNKDADCPAGLACNCPNDERPGGSDCSPMAGTPQDPMARICLARPKPAPAPATQP